MRDWNSVALRAEARITDEQVETLAAQLGGLDPLALRQCRIGLIEGAELRALRCAGERWYAERPTWAYSFPEVDGDRRVIGISLRSPKGAKSAPKGAQRGVTWPCNFDDLPEPVLVVEGASDVAAAVSAGCAAVGRPTAASSAHLADLLRWREMVLVVGENDRKPDGSWPGRDGAKKVARELADALPDVLVKITFPPAEHKDIRGWLSALKGAGVE